MQSRELILDSKEDESWRWSNSLAAKDGQQDTIIESLRTAISGYKNAHARKELVSFVVSCVLNQGFALPEAICASIYI